ncbi:MAG TPA: Asp-tRNA(Asn)/Glu-tRNA(Gln) amidotransferase subunit GatC [Candidatus Binatia bacterium]|nr:Asp-tRNA(Asn)/Glu-tRNA(Gln) amidotransferase subunit GatC [Candidatus Binatia bacterium]
MAITHEEVRRVAALARLRLAPEEIERLAADLSHILDAFTRLQTLDTTGIAPTAHAEDVVLPLRPDEVVNPPADEALLAGAPDRRERRFRVPRIIE